MKKLSRKAKVGVFYAVMIVAFLTLSLAASAMFFEAATKEGTAGIRGENEELSMYGRHTNNHTPLHTPHTRHTRQFQPHTLSRFNPQTLQKLFFWKI
ncbi:MAG: hypothetical protein ACD_63C00158G0008 [uncultured bacterium]|nr:MAG: hypothetical protein ACD_63C00158G0008 [uncultured bacterium]